MKIKALALLMISAAFLMGCVKQQNQPTSSGTDQSSQTSEFQPEYLTFVDKGNIRIDIFDVDIQFSFGNEALTQAVNVTTLKSGSHISVNKNSEIENYYFILFAEKDGRHTIKYLTPGGDELTEFVELNSFKNFFNDFDSERGYMAISTGAKAQWTKGLNAKLDAEIAPYADN